MALFEIALKALTDEERNLFEEWERAAAEICEEERKEEEKKGVPIQRTVVENIHSEEYFYDGDPKRPEVFIQFLQELAQAYMALSPSGITPRRCYKTVCQSFSGCRQPIRCPKPKTLLRYVPLRKLFERIMIPKSEDKEEERYEEYGWYRIKGKSFFEELVIGEWEKVGRELLAKAKLAHKEAKVVFVTFPETDGRAPDESNGSVFLMRTLGFPMTEDDSVVKLVYESRNEDLLCFPTVADACWNHYFKSATNDDPHGWTEPIGDKTARGYPEAVHQNREIGQLSELPLIIEPI